LQRRIGPRFAHHARFAIGCVEVDHLGRRDGSLPKCVEAAAMQIVADEDTFGRNRL